MNTMKYIHLGKAYLEDAQTHFDCRKARTVDQAKGLISLAMNVYQSLMMSDSSGNPTSYRWDL